MAKLWFFFITLMMSLFASSKGGEKVVGWFVGNNSKLETFSMVLLYTYS